MAVLCRAIGGVESRAGDRLTTEPRNRDRLPPRARDRQAASRRWQPMARGPARWTAGSRRPCPVPATPTRRPRRALPLDGTAASGQSACSLATGLGGATLAFRPTGTMRPTRHRRVRGSGRRGCLGHPGRRGKVWPVGTAPRMVANQGKSGRQGTLVRCLPAPPPRRPRACSPTDARPAAPDFGSLPIFQRVREAAGPAPGVGSRSCDPDYGGCHAVRRLLPPLQRYAAGAQQVGGQEGQMPEMFRRNCPARGPKPSETAASVCSEDRVNRSSGPRRRGCGKARSSNPRPKPHGDGASAEISGESSPQRRIALARACGDG